MKLIKIKKKKNLSKVCQESKSCSKGGAGKPSQGPFVGIRLLTAGVLAEECNHRSVLNPEWSGRVQPWQVQCYRD